jgi:hypothetical protein
MRSIIRGLFFVVCALFVMILTAETAPAQVKTVTTEGEAAIVNNDIPSARQEAVARAKWAAIEQVVGVQVKAESFVQNMTLVEDVMKTQVTGVVRKFDILDQQSKKGDIYWVRMRSWVEPTKAQQAVSTLGLNGAVAVFVPARKPQVGGGGEFEETNIFSETLIGKLTAQDYKVVDVAPTGAADAAEIESAAKGGHTLTLRSLMYKFLSNILIIGKTDYTISTKKGEDIGYGLSMPFNNVTVRLTYRIVAKNNKTGAVEVLTAGAEQARGLANNVEDAAASALKDLAEKMTPKILDKISQYIQGNVKKIDVKVAGVTNIDTNMEVKGILQNIVWVTGVDDKEMGEYIVSYPENSLYLANSIKQKGNFTITNFTPYSITLEYQK